MSKLPRFRYHKVFLVGWEVVLSLFQHTHPLYMYNHAAFVLSRGSGSASPVGVFKSITMSVIKNFLGRDVNGLILT